MPFLRDVKKRDIFTPDSIGCLSACITVNISVQHNTLKLSIIVTVVSVTAAVIKYNYDHVKIILWHKAQSSRQIIAAELHLLKKLLIIIHFWASPQHSHLVVKQFNAKFSSVSIKEENAN